MTNKQDYYAVSVNEDRQNGSGTSSTLNGLHSSCQKGKDVQATELQYHDEECAHTRNLTKSFISRYQLHKILFENFLRWFFGAVVLLFIFATLKIYESKGSTKPSEKRTFNVIITGLQILLALNVCDIIPKCKSSNLVANKLLSHSFCMSLAIRTEGNPGLTDINTDSSALKDLAKILRWRVLAEKAHSIHEVDLILSADSLTKLVRLWCGHVRDIFGEAWRWSVNIQQTKDHAAGPGSTPVLVPSKDEHSSTHGKIIGELFWSLTKISSWLLINIVRNHSHA